MGVNNYQLVSKESIQNLLVFGFIISVFIWELFSHFPNNVLSFDVFGAYLHLPANFIYHDPFLTDWSWIEEVNQKYNATPSYYQFWQAETGRQVIKYPLGFALIYAPFFFLGHFLADFLGYPQDGFSAPYQWLIIIGHCIYILLGLWVSYKVLKRFFSQKLSHLLLLILFFGTNFFFTTTVMIGMPHGHLFLFYALILYFSDEWHKSPNYKNSFFLGLAIGIAAIIRATEILAILIPLLWNMKSFRDLKERWILIKVHWKKILILSFTIVAIGSIQLVYYYLATGHFFVDAYNNAGEGFDFLNPHLFNYLFSARKGWLIYTPIFIISFFGFWKMKKDKHPAFLALFAFTLLNIYLLSSWTCWWFAESFGQRSLVQSYLILLIPMGYFLIPANSAGPLQKITTYSIIFAFVFLNQFQTWQLHIGLIHPSRMTSDAYWLHFLKSKPDPKFHELLLVDKNVPAIQRFELDKDKLNLARTLCFRFIDESWQKMNCASCGQPSQIQGTEVNSQSIYSKDIVLAYPEITTKQNVIIKLEAWVYCIDNSIQIEQMPKVEIRPKLVFKMRHKGKPYYDRYLAIEQTNQFKLNEWLLVEHIFYSADVRNMDKDEVQIFAWLDSPGAFKVDHIRLSIYEGLK